MTIVSVLSLVAWLYLCFLHGRFWLASERLDEGDPAPSLWPSVAAVVPARDEADVIEAAIGSLLEQEYPGAFHVVLVDDESQDGTAARAQALADPQGRLQVRSTPPRPPGWVGKMWAVHTGVSGATESWPEVDYFLLTDADVAHTPRNLERLVRRAEVRRLDLVSLMVRLDASAGWARLLIPAFVYFFAQLYPFPWVNDPKARTAGAAGGCVLVRREALQRAGGVERLRSEIIDDCALGRAIKENGPIWLGVTTSEKSIRPYAGLGEIWNMVARSAYTQLGYQPAFAFGTTLGLALLFVIPLVATAVGIARGDAIVAGAGGIAWAIQAATFLPTLTLYHSPRSAAGWAWGLPVAGILYGAMTLDSVRRHYTGRGAEWKGRVGAGAEVSATTETSSSAR